MAAALASRAAAQPRSPTLSKQQLPAEVLTQILQDLERRSVTTSEEVGLLQLSTGSASGWQEKASEATGAEESDSATPQIQILRLCSFAASVADGLSDIPRSSHLCSFPPISKDFG